MAKYFESGTAIVASFSQMGQSPLDLRNLIVDGDTLDKELDSNEEFYSLDVLYDGAGPVYVQNPSSEDKDGNIKYKKGWYYLSWPDQNKWKENKLDSTKPKGNPPKWVYMYDAPDVEDKIKGLGVIYKAKGDITKAKLEAIAREEDRDKNRAGEVWNLTEDFTVDSGADYIDAFDVNSRTFKKGDQVLITAEGILDKLHGIVDYKEFADNSLTAGSGLGLVKKPTTSDDGKFLKSDGSWGTPDNTTYSDFTGASSTKGGSSGLVPAPNKDDTEKFLKGDGTWGTVNTETYKGSNGIQIGISGLDDSTKKTIGIPGLNGADGLRLVMTHTTDTIEYTADGKTKKVANIANAFSQRLDNKNTNTQQLIVLKPDTSSSGHIYANTSGINFASSDLSVRDGETKGFKYGDTSGVVFGDNITFYTPNSFGSIPDMDNNFFKAGPSNVRYGANPTTGFGYFDWGWGSTAEQAMLDNIATEMKSELFGASSECRGFSKIYFKDLGDSLKTLVKKKAADLHKIYTYTVDGTTYKFSQNTQKLLEYWYNKNNTHKLPDLCYRYDPSQYIVSLHNMCISGGMMSYDCTENALISSKYYKLYTDEVKKLYKAKNEEELKDITITERQTPFVGNYGRWARANYWSNLTTGYIIHSKMQDYIKNTYWPYTIIKTGENYSLNKDTKPYNQNFNWPKTVMDNAHGLFDPYLRPLNTHVSLECTMRTHEDNASNVNWTLLGAFSQSVQEIEITIGKNRATIRLDRIFEFNKAIKNNERTLESAGKATIEWHAPKNTQETLLERYQFMVRIFPDFWFQKNFAVWTCSEGNIEILCRVNPEISTDSLDCSVYGNTNIREKTNYLTNYSDLQEVYSIINVDSPNDSSDGRMYKSATELPSFRANYYGRNNDGTFYCKPDAKFGYTDRTSGNEFGLVKDGGIEYTEYSVIVTDECDKLSYKHVSSLSDSDSESGYSSWVTSGNTRTRSKTTRKIKGNIADRACGDNLWPVNCTLYEKIDTQTSNYNSTTGTWSEPTNTSTYYKYEYGDYTIDRTTGVINHSVQPKASILSTEYNNNGVEIPTDTLNYDFYPATRAFNISVEEYKSIANISAGSGINITEDNSGLVISATNTTNNDTKNTAGSSNTPDKLYVIGATSQNSTGVVTYSNSSVYIDKNKLYSDNNEVVTTSSSITVTAWGDSNDTTESYTFYGKKNS